MCLAAIPLIGALLSVAQAGVGFAQASAQADAQNAYAEQNRLSAIAAANDKYASLANNTLQERESASQQLLQKNIEFAQAQGKAKVSSGEAGVSGLSVAALLGDFEAQRGRAVDAIDTNYQIKRQYNIDEGVATQHQAIARINSVRGAAKPSPLAYVIQGIGGAVGSFSKTGGLAIA